MRKGGTMMEAIVLTDLKTSKINWNALIKATQMPDELHEHFKELSQENPLFDGPICS